MTSRAAIAWLAATSLAGSSLVGCANPKHTLMAADVAVIAAGVAVGVASNPNNCDAPDFGAGIGCVERGIGGFYAASALVAVGALLLLGTAVLYPAEQAALAPPPTSSTTPSAVTATSTLASASPDSELGTLARRANLAARAGHCYEVHQLANAIDKLDRDYRERELMHDTAIAQCLD